MPVQVAGLRLVAGARTPDLFSLRIPSAWSPSSGSAWSPSSGRTAGRDPAGWLDHALFDGKLARTLALLSHSGYRGNAGARDLAGEIDGYLVGRKVEIMTYPLAIEKGNRST